MNKKTHQLVYPPDPGAWLLDAVKGKAPQRQSEGLKDYHVRSGSIQNRVVNGNTALSYIADYTGRPGQPMLEYMVRVLGKINKANFFRLLPDTPETSDLIARLNPIVETLSIP